MNSNRHLLQEGASLLGLRFEEKQLAQFEIYQNELIQWNAKTNLISGKTVGDIPKRHFLDSLTAARYIANQNSRLIDIGCGAGFPGIPLKIALPSLKLYLLETNRKKISFLKNLLRLLNLADAFTLHDRTETLVRTNTWREKFDVAVSRASLKLPDLLPLSNYFLVPGGLLITLKSLDVDQELSASRAIQNESKIIKIIQHDINIPLLGPPRKIIIAEKAK